MASKASPKRETKYDPPKFELKGFIRCDLDKDQLSRIKGQEADVLKLFDIAETLVDNGYKFGFSHDTYNSCYQASLTCTNKENQNYGFCLTGRGPSLPQALMVLMFKHFEICGEAWPVNEDFGKIRSEWG